MVKKLWIFVGIVVALIALWTLFTLTWSYSAGERAGYVQKFSKKGWVCKTWEGEVAMTTLPGTLPETFRFSVRDEAVARQITDTMGERVVLTYEQHIGLPSCFGETDHFVTSVRTRPVEAMPLPGGGQVAPAPPPVPAPQVPEPPPTQ